MNNTQLRKLNKITYILNLVMNKFGLIFFKPHVDAFISDPANRSLLFEVYDKIEKTVKE